MTPEIEKVIKEAIRENVNGKIDRLRLEQSNAHQNLHDEIQDVKNSIKEMTEIFGNLSGFFKTSILIAKWFLPVGGTISLIWAGFKFLVRTTK